MDATAHSEAPSRFDVEGFPTLKFFRSGKATDYTGGRTESEIVNWVRKKAGPAAKTLSAVADVESFKDASEVAVLGVFSSADSADAKVCGWIS
jgi:protein disulfide-isomerase A1